MLSDDVWRTRYGSDPSIVGRAINVNGIPHTIIGVMPPRFAFPENHRLWVPLARYGEPTSREERPLQIFARVKRGLSIEQARADLAAIGARLARTYPRLTRTGASAPVRCVNGCSRIRSS